MGIQSGQLRTFDITKDRSLRISDQAPCTVALIATDGSSEKQVFPGRIQSFQRGRLSVSCMRSIPSFRAITIECEDTLFLCEVLSSTAELSEQKWIVLLEVKHVLTALQSLLTLRAQLLNAELGTRSTFVADAALAA